MAPSRSQAKSKKSKAKARLREARKAGAAFNARQLLADATAKLEQGDPAGALHLAQSAHERIGDEDPRHSAALAVLLGQIHVELGELDDARRWFLKAVEADPEADGGGGGGGDNSGVAADDDELENRRGGGAEKFLWLAQLSEEGGHDSAAWFEKGAEVLRRQIARLMDSVASRPHSQDLQLAAAEERKRRLAQALCGLAELYMTDLSWEADAEVRCEALVTEATMVAPGLADAWQTVANVRISQSRVDEAKAALGRSLDLWKDLEPEDPLVPAFPTRVSLVRLLVEVGMEETAIDVADRLIAEDDESVEVWYLGGFAGYNLGERLKGESEDKKADPEAWKAAWRTARKWLTRCLELFVREEYEDERLGEHAKELLATIKGELGEPVAGEDDEDDAWEDADDDGDGDEDGDTAMT